MWNKKPKEPIIVKLELGEDLRKRIGKELFAHTGRHPDSLFGSSNYPVEMIVSEKYFNQINAFLSEFERKEGIMSKLTKKNEELMVWENKLNTIFQQELNRCYDSIRNSVDKEKFIYDMGYAVFMVWKDKIYRREKSLWEEEKRVDGNVASYFLEKLTCI